MNTEKILNDVKEKLNFNGDTCNFSYEQREERPFSILFNVVISSEEKKRYILKISTTERSCEHEYECYRYLLKNNIPTINVIFFSKEYNYILSEMVDLTSLNSYLKHNQRSLVHKKLNDFLNLLIKNTQFHTLFDSFEVQHYIHKRFYDLRSINQQQKDYLWKKIAALICDADQSKSVNCFVSDLSFGNICFDNKGELLILDMGDAKFGNVHDNLAQVFLNLKFESKNINYLTQSIQGLDKNEIENLLISQDQFKIFKIKHIINRIHFLERRTYKGNFLLRIVKLIDTKIVGLVYKQYLFKLL